LDLSWTFFVQESWDELWGKTKYAFQFVYDNYIDKVSKPSSILTMKFGIKNSVKADLRYGSGTMAIDILCHWGFAAVL
jgi:hypothetical protein